MHYCVTPEFDYWLRHLPPSVTQTHAARFDTAVIEMIEEVVYPGCLIDHEHSELLLERLRLPQRLCGAGRRSRFDLCPVAYVSGFIELRDYYLRLIYYLYAAYFWWLVKQLGVCRQHT